MKAAACPAQALVDLGRAIRRNHHYFSDLRLDFVMEQVEDGNNIGPHLTWRNGKWFLTAPLPIAVISQQLVQRHDISRALASQKVFESRNIFTMAIVRQPTVIAILIAVGLNLGARGK